SLDRVDPVAKFVGGEGRGPTIVGERCQRREAPVGFAGMAVQQSAGDVVVTVAEDRCSDRDQVAEDSLCSVTTTVDLRLYFFDYDAFASLYRFHITHFSDATSGLHGIPVVHTLRGSVEKLKGCSLRRCILSCGRLPAERPGGEESNFFIGIV